MNDARIAELLEPFLSDNSRRTAALSPSQVRLISMYVDLLLRWNDRVNLTAIREPEDIVTRHFGESIFAARHLFPPPEVEAGTTAHVIDIGSGAGFPGLPAKIWAPHIRLTLIESNQKKATFLREVVRHLGLANVDVFAARAKTYPGVPGRCGHVSGCRTVRIDPYRCCRFGAPWRMPGCHDRKETAGYSPPALAGTAVERSNRPSTLIPSVPDHRKERTWVVTATSICGTIL